MRNIDRRLEELEAKAKQRRNMPNDEKLERQLEELFSTPWEPKPDEWVDVPGYGRLRPASDWPEPNNLKPWAQQFVDCFGMKYIDGRWFWISP